MRLGEAAAAATHAAPSALLRNLDVFLAINTIKTFIRKAVLSAFETSSGRIFRPPHFDPNATYLFQIRLYLSSQ